MRSTLILIILPFYFHARSLRLGVKKTEMENSFEKTRFLVFFKNLKKPSKDQNLVFLGFF